jgi:hypothetical protein
MRYLVRARVKPGREAALLRAIEDGTLGRGSVAGGEYLRNMRDARLCDDGTTRWVEVCFCGTPLDEERPYWEQYFESRAGAGRPHPVALSRRSGPGSMGLLRLRLQRQARAADGDVGQTIPRRAPRIGRSTVVQVNPDRLRQKARAAVFRIGDLIDPTQAICCTGGSERQSTACISTNAPTWPSSDDAIGWTLTA